MTPIRLISVTIATLFILSACNNQSEKDVALEAQLRQDSIRQAKQEAQLKARADSLAIVMAEEQRRQEEQARREMEEKLAKPTHNPNGSITIQAEAWRSEEYAKKRLGFWKSEGFDAAYVVQTGNENTGDIWYRIRLLKVNNEQLTSTMANLKNKYPTEFWVVE
jgi:hypothetical protein